jgi:hypothetical protein
MKTLGISKVDKMGLSGISDQLEYFDFLHYLLQVEIIIEGLS